MNSARILVVEDEPQIRRVMRVALTSEGYIVSDARTGEEALERLREDKPDLILLAMNLPGMGGLETCRAIRSGSDAAIIMLTVRNTEQDKVDALDAGADDYVTKPFNSRELLARIRAALRRLPMSPDSGPAVIRTGDIEIDIAARHLTVRGQTVRLTPKEFDVLNYFVHNPNVPIPHTKLLQAVWGPDYGDQRECLRESVDKLRTEL